MYAFKHISLTALLLVASCSPMQISAGHPQQANGSYVIALGALLASGLVATSVYKYGMRCTQATGISALVGITSWIFINKLARTHTISEVAKALEVPLIPKNSLLDITPAAILGSAILASISFYTAYMYYGRSDRTDNNKIDTSDFYIVLNKN